MPNPTNLLIRFAEAKKSRIFPFLLLVALSVASCDLFEANKGGTIRFELSYTDEAYDKKSLEEYIANHKSLGRVYLTEKEINPDFLDH
ncbi:MAG: hypothetical protein J5736_02830, partial [Bacilli bacterium]|nr:hypothetical protein [Bacilli bacterium]